MFKPVYNLKVSLIRLLGCESGLTQHPTTNRVCYQFISSNDTWDQARSYCQNFEGELASVTSNEKNNFLTTLTMKECWIGGYMEALGNGLMEVTGNIPTGAVVSLIINIFYR